MSIKVILVPVTDEAASVQAIGLALTIAKSFQAHLIGLHMRPDPHASMADVAAQVPADALERIVSHAQGQLDDRSITARQLFAGLCATQSTKLLDHATTGAGASASWQERMGDPAHLIPLAGRLADILVVAKPPAGGDGGLAEIAIDAIFSTGRPVVLAPEAEVASVGKRLVIAWNRSAEAARTVAAALPFIARAEHVLVLSAGTQMPHGPSAADLARYLKHHGVAAEIAWIKDGIRPEKVVLSRAQEMDADLIVMAAYSRSRLRERILGGFTRYMLRHTTVPLFMTR